MPPLHLSSLCQRPFGVSSSQKLHSSENQQQTRLKELIWQKINKTYENKLVSTLFLFNALGKMSNSVGITLFAQDMII